MESPISKGARVEARAANHVHARSVAAPATGDALPGARAMRRPGLGARVLRVLRKERPQNALTVCAPIAPDRLDALRRVLADDAPGAGGTALRDALAQVGTIHFARFTVLEACSDPQGREIPAALVFCSDFDGALDAQVEALAQRGELDPVLGCCAGFPVRPDRASRAAFLRRHRVPEVTFYVNTLGRTVRQVRGEEALRQRIRAWLDQQPALPRDDQALRAAIQAFVRSQPDLAWALSPAPAFNPPAWERVRRRLAALDIAGAFDALRRVLFFVPDNGREVGSRATHARVQALTRFEDWTPQNPFGAVGFIESGGPFFWRGLISQIPVGLILPLADWLSYGVFNAGSLAGVRSIHFARWVPIDFVRSPYGFRVPSRAMFFSNYDGSQESYMGEFVDTVAWGLNATFSRAVGYPKTRALVFDGAKNEQAFKHFIRRVQLPTDVWYAAYPQLSAANIANNAALRAGLGGVLGAAATRAWLQRF